MPPARPATDGPYPEAKVRDAMAQWTAILVQEQLYPVMAVAQGKDIDMAVLSTDIYTDAELEVLAVVVMEELRQRNALKN